MGQIINCVKIFNNNYSTDFTLAIDQEYYMVDDLITVSGTITAPNKVTNIRIYYDSWYTNIMTSTSPVYWNGTTGVYTFNNIYASVLYDVVKVEVTWENGTILEKIVDVDVMAA